MNIVLNRLDERLIHGQILVSYVKKLSARQILIADDRLAGDPLIKSVLQAILPQTVHVTVLTVRQAAELIYRENDEHGERTLVLYKEPESVFEIYREGYRLPSLNVGFLSAGPTRRKLTEFVYASDEEVLIFKRLMDRGVDVYIQVVHTEIRLPMKEIVDRMAVPDQKKKGGE